MVKGQKKTFTSKAAKCLVLQSKVKKFRSLIHHF